MTKCERCGQPLNDKESYDMWLLVTRYDENGDCEKTSMDPNDEDIDRDYISIGIDCCGPLVVKEWNKLVAQVTAPIDEEKQT